MQRVESSSDDYSTLRFSSALGAYCWTTDGRRYIDLVCGQGPVVLGHAHPVVTDAVVRQLKRGVLLPGPGPALDELRGLLLTLYPTCTDLLTFKTGSEAVTAAIRLSRAGTGRQRILRVGFHGWHDQLVSPYIRCHSYQAASFEQSWPVGVPHAVYTDLVDTWHGDDPKELLALVKSDGEQLAAVLVDPVQLRPPAAGSIAVRLSAAVRERGALLIFDESKTGLRVHLGGAQALYGMAPDLTILGKALANGFPLAVVLGRSELIELATASRIKGTFQFELASIAAAVATVTTLQALDGPATLHARGLQLVDGLNDVFRTTGHPDITAIGYQWPCLPYIHFAPAAARLRDPYYRGMLECGVLLMRRHMSYVSLALSRADVDEVVAATADVMSQLVAG